MKNKLISNNQRLLIPIEERLNSHPFILPKIIQNYHIQTLLTPYFPHFQIKLPEPKRIFFNLTNDSKIIGECYFQNTFSQRPTIVILNGLSYSDNTFFSKTVSYKAHYLGYNCITIKQRGEGDSVYHSKSVFAAYPQHDIPIVLEHIYSLGLKNLFLVGTSLGAWSILLTIEHMRQKTKKYLSGIVAISAPDSLLGSWNHMDNHPLYSWLFLQIDKNLIKKRATIDPRGLWDLNKLQNIKSKRDLFSSYFSTHTVGSKNNEVTPEEYSKNTEIIAKLNSIKIPTLIIHAKDDPICSIQPFLQIKNPNIITLFTKFGGHSGFYTTQKRYGDLDGLWAQNRLLEFIQML